MEEEEEVDIVGEFDGFMSKSEREISNISSGQILSCDYTVHPRWLTDNNEVTWPEHFPKQSSQDEMEMVQDEVVIEEPAPIDFDWCEETSNCGDIILEQDIPATLEEEVITNSGTETENENYYENKSQHRNSVSSSKSTHSLEVTSRPHPRSLLKKNYINHVEKPPSKFRKTLLVNKNLLKGNQVQLNVGQQQQHFDQGRASTSSSLNEIKISLDKTTSKSSITSSSEVKKQLKPSSINARQLKNAPKFRKTVKIQRTEVFQSKNLRNLTKKLRQRTQGGRKSDIKNTLKSNNCDYYKYKNEDGSAEDDDGDDDDNRRFDSRLGSNCGSSGKAGGKGKRGKKFVDMHGENITINHDVESGSTLDPRKQSILEENSLEIIKVKKEESDGSDLEIDIESSDNIVLTQMLPPPLPDIIPYNEIKKEEPTDIKPPPPPPPVQIKSPKKPIVDKEKTFVEPVNFQYTDDSQTCSVELNRILDSLEEPQTESLINQQEVTELEKYFHLEFFEGRPTKTPERYMKIRNFIFNTWKESKPSYISKTAVRQGLKHCGDVNCISRIHSLLEQIGVINFGCEQFEYVRPLRKLVDWFAQPTRNKPNASNNISTAAILERRPRTKSNCSREHAMPLIDTNYTVSHVDGRSTIVVASSKSDNSDDEQDNKKPIKPEFQLIKCLRFNNRERLAPFKVSITLSTLLCLQLHALSARNEIMGFLGGHRSKSCGRNKLSLSRYKPCKTSAQSGVMCEMCPVSQVEQSDSLIEEGYDLLGWFHSHPTFPPNPSRTDVATQADMQLQFSLENERPFIGFILSCIDMKFKCMYVLSEDLHNLNEHTVPYELDVDIIKDCSNFKNEINDVFDIIDKNCDQYPLILKKFATSANLLLKQFGYGTDVMSYLSNVLY